MISLTLSADFIRPMLRDEDPDSHMDPMKELSAELRAEIAGWNEDYQEIVPLDLPERSAALAIITDLDQRGLELADRVRLELRAARIRYYSEGQLRYLP